MAGALLLHLVCPAPSHLPPTATLCCCAPPPIRLPRFPVHLRSRSRTLPNAPASGCPSPSDRCRCALLLLFSPPPAHTHLSAEGSIASLGDLLSSDVALRQGVHRATLSALLHAKHSKDPSLYGWAAAAAAVQLIRRVYQ
jgi:hypothetical protein